MGDLKIKNIFTKTAGLRPKEPTLSFYFNNGLKLDSLESSRLARAKTFIWDGFITSTVSHIWAHLFNRVSDRKNRKKDIIYLGGTFT